VDERVDPAPRLGRHPVRADFPVSHPGS